MIGPGDRPVYIPPWLVDLLGLAAALIIAIVIGAHILGVW